MNENKTNYINNLVTSINEMLDPIVVATYVEVEKNNNIVLPGIRFKCDEEINVQPVIYIDRLLEKNIEVSEAADLLVKEYLKIAPDEVPSGMFLSLLTDIEFIHKNVYPMLTKNPVKDWITSNFLDMYIAFYIQLNESGTVMVTEKLLENIGIEPFTLKYWAIANESYITRFQSFKEAMTGMDPAFGEMLPEEDVMYILTNKKSFRGAAQMLDDITLELISNKLNDSFYIIPSSVHELIIVPYKFAGVTDDLKSLICTVNSDESLIPAKDVLSNSLYLYIKDSSKIKIII